jgi:hypothetical protein
MREEAQSPRYRALRNRATHRRRQTHSVGRGSAGPGQCAGGGREEGLRARTFCGVSFRCPLTLAKPTSNIPRLDVCLCPQRTRRIESFSWQALRPSEVRGPNLRGLASDSLRPPPTNSYAFDEKVGITRHDHDSTGRFQAEVAIRVSYATF